MKLIPILSATRNCGNEFESTKYQKSKTNETLSIDLFSIYSTNVNVIQKKSKKNTQKIHLEINYHSKKNMLQFTYFIAKRWLKFCNPTTKFVCCVNACQFHSQQTFKHTHTHKCSLLWHKSRMIVQTH